MHELRATDLTDAVIASLGPDTPPRTRAVMAALVRHLHAFIEEVQLTEDEWLRGLQFLTAVGQKCDEKRQEFILLSDTLGVTAVKDRVNHPSAAGATEHTLLGPFHRAGAPATPMGANLAAGLPGERTRMRGRVLDTAGAPIGGATLDVWQADAEGFYDLQRPDLEGMALRGTFTTGPDGRYAFETIKPSPYPIPDDGPVGQMLRALGRHPYRPAHVHFIVSAPGRQTLTTELFAAGDPYLASDAVFGVRDSLVVPFAPEAGGEPGVNVVEYDFVLEPA
jgi:protocatechuate 3,4-dioxygenase beta subunit